jgi:hypothetical protein
MGGRRAELRAFLVKAQELVRILAGPLAMANLVARTNGVALAEVQGQ